MKKNLLLRLCLMVSAVLALYSCISDDLPLQENSSGDNSFQIFSNRSSQYARKRGSTLYYQEAFRDLYFYYYKNHPKEAPDFRDFKKSYIDFRFASQVMYAEDSTRYVLFPYIEDEQVKYVMACSVDSKHSYVAFYFPEKNKVVQDAITTFAMSIQGKGTPGFDQNNPVPIEEVVIPTPPRQPSFLMPFEPVFNYPMPPPGDCGTYGNCGGGGSSSPPIIPPPATSCEKIKEKQNNLKYADKYNALNKAEIFNMNKERGFYEKQPPLGVNVESGFVQIDGSPGSSGLDLPDDTTGISGLFHSHNNADGSIKIFSPTDVKTFINTFLKNAGTYGGGYGNAYSTVVTSEGSYTIKYTGTTHPGGVDYYTAQSWNKWYKEQMAEIQNEDGHFPQDKVEAVFTRFLQEVVNKPGLEVFKVTANTAAKMTYNPTTKKVYQTNCPQ